MDYVGNIPTYPCLAFSRFRILHRLTEVVLLRIRCRTAVQSRAALRSAGVASCAAVRLPEPCSDMRCGAVTRTVFRYMGHVGWRRFGKPGIRKSRNPEIRKSRNPEIRKLRSSAANPSALSDPRGEFATSAVSRKASYQWCCAGIRWACRNVLGSSMVFLGVFRTRLGCIGDRRWGWNG